MGIESVPLNARPFRHHADAGERGTNAAMELDGGFHNTPPGFRLLLGAACEGVSPGHFILLHCDVHPILTRASIFATQSCIINLCGCRPRGPLRPFNPSKEDPMETKIDEIA